MKASARAKEAAWEAKNAFDIGDHVLALAAAARAVAFGDLSAETVALFDLLLDATEPNAAAALLDHLLTDAWGDWPPAFHARVATRRFDALRQSPSADPEAIAAAAVETLEAAAAGNEDAWQPIADPASLGALLDAVAWPAWLAPALEQFAYAPAPALRAQAAGRAEAYAVARAADADLARAVERALFTLGEPAAARRVEAARKAARPRPAPPKAIPSPRLDGLVVLVAGGHDRLRAAARADLLGAGAREVREVPPAWEGQRGGRLVDRLAGADAVVLVIRQIDHATGESVETAAALAGVPVTRARAAGVAAIRAAAVACRRSG